MVAEISIDHVGDYIFGFGGMGGEYKCFNRIFLVDVGEVGGI